MKPHRIRMTHNLLLNYGLYRKMEIYVIIKIMHIFLRAIFSLNIFIFTGELLTKKKNFISLAATQSNSR